jgi:hypothetical protein
MDDWKFQAFRAVNGHQTHSIKSLRSIGKLTEIAVISETYQSPHSFEKPLDG